MEKQKSNNERDDELLSALLDGELDAAAADALTERLAQEPALAARLEALRSADANVRALFAEADKVPMPPKVLELLDVERPAVDNVVAFPRRVIERFTTAPVAIAASIALAAGFLVDRLLVSAQTPGDGIATLEARTVPQNSEVFAVLENSTGESEIVLRDGTAARVLLTFADENGDWCRQLKISAPAGQVDALACRRNGSWRNEVLAFGEASGSEYQPASQSSHEVIRSAVDKMIGPRTPLDADGEKRLISSRWQEKNLNFAE